MYVAIQGYKRPCFYTDILLRKENLQSSKLQSSSLAYLFGITRHHTALLHILFPSAPSLRLDWAKRRSARPGKCSMEF